MAGGFSAGGMGQGILSVTVKDTATLYSSYMPYVENGGLFIPTHKKYKLGDEVFVLLSLIDEPEKIPTSAKVIWVTPKGAQGNRLAGIGVQFSEQDTLLVGKIETYLAGMIASERPTYTM